MWNEQHYFGEGTGMNDQSNVISWFTYLLREEKEKMRIDEAKKREILNKLILLIREKIRM